MSDEIPVGSPPAPPGRHAAPGGWYADPARPGQERYWDGWNWTRNVRPAEQAPAGQARAGQAFGASSPYAGPAGPAGQAGWPAHAPGAPAVRTTADGVPLAGWGFRALALLLDLFLLMFVNQVVATATGWGAAVNAATEEVVKYIQGAGGNLDPNRIVDLLMVPEQWYLTLAAAATFVLYSALMLRFRGATLGKLAAGLRVVPAGRGQQSSGLSWGRAIGRPLVYQVIGQVFGPLQVLNLLWPLWDRDRQTLHDKVARTQVVRVR